MFVGYATSSAVLQTIGYYWLLLTGYGLLLFPLSTLLYLLLKKRGIRWIGYGVLAVYLIMIFVGTYNAWSPIVRTYDITIDKDIERENLQIVMASDFHLGPIVGKPHLQRFVDLVDSIQPDLVLIPGDLIDDHIEPFLADNMGEVLKQVKAPLGVYATLGNHDYYGNDDEQIVETMESLGVEMLTDETIMIENEIYLTGRNDDTDDSRIKISDLVDALDPTKPLIMLDHQPNELDLAQKNGVDVILSGHTHSGQVFPGNLITNAIFENDYGLLQKEQMYSLVSSGFGTWGPPLRIGTRSEIFVINIEFGSK
ncbi:metallophosphoesterase [Fredinandcohnia sp. 179-A 10B2 NHS]|uniref:metallophosphoesterase n=1 Tax=Fredinandcohnia sp. 179-A 10B2 NHS TaxID=3235176 RepID=UPI00399FC7C0